MKQQIQGYPKYEHSGVEWLGEIPEHWKYSKIKTGYEVRLGKMLQPQALEENETIEPYLRSANVLWEGIDITDIQYMWFSPDEKRKYGIIAGDLIVCEGGDVGRSAIWNAQIFPCYIQNAVHRVRARKSFCNKFLYYWLFTLKSQGYIDLICSKATIAHLTEIKLANLPLLAPPLSEQQAIADFLDRHTARIDALIAKYRRLLELLDEKRAALINQAVTRGLNPDVKMKDSGVPWLGEIPEHWEVRKLKYFANIIFSNVDKHSLENEEPVFLCNYVDVYKNKYISRGLVFMKATATKEESKKFQLKKNDVLITKDSESWNDIAIPSHVIEDLENVLCGYHLALVRPNAQWINSGFLFFSFSTRSINYQFEVEATGITRYGIDQSSVSSGLFYIPPLPEQCTIVNFLNHKTKIIDNVKEKISTKITKLQEYRTALISAAVTGKIDVRAQEG